MTVFYVIASTLPSILQLFLHELFLYLLKHLAVILLFNRREWKANNNAKWRRKKKKKMHLKRKKISLFPLQKMLGDGALFRLCCFKGNIEGRQSNYLIWIRDIWMVVVFFFSFSSLLFHPPVFALVGQLNGRLARPMAMSANIVYKLIVPLFASRLCRNEGGWCIVAVFWAEIRINYKPRCSLFGDVHDSHFHSTR